MQDGWNGDALRCGNVVDRERKAPQPGAAYLGSDQLVALRHALNEAEADIRGTQELSAQPRSTRLVPLGGQQHVRLGRRTDQEGRQFTG